MARILMIALIMILCSCNKKHSCCKVEPLDTVSYQYIEASSKKKARQSCQELGSGWYLTADANCLGG